MNGTARLVAHLKRRPHTYGEMLAYGISTAPWKRVQEFIASGANYAASALECGRAHVLRQPAWQLRKGKNSRGLVTWRIVRSR